MGPVPQRTPGELKSAIDTMFRIRAVESPPDEQGSRTVWHRGAKGADLVSWVDPDGSVTRQELFLFEDYFLFERAAGLKTGVALESTEAALSPGSSGIAFDQDAVLRRKRLEHAARALAAYEGADVLIGHLKQVVTLAAQGKALEADRAAAAQPSKLRLEDVVAASQELQHRELRARLALRNRNVLLVVVALLLSAATVALWVALK